MPGYMLSYNTHADILDDLPFRLRAAGYTGVGYSLQADEDNLEVFVDQATTVADIEAALVGPAAQISYDVSNPLSVPLNGTADVVVTAPEGKTLKLSIPAGVFIPVSGTSWVVPAGGQVTVTFGPSSLAGSTAVQFGLADESARPAGLELRFE